jgi:hypothetical protein
MDAAHSHFLNERREKIRREYIRMLSLHEFVKPKSGMPMHSPRSPIYDETLARCTRAVYPLRFLQTAAWRWASVFLWLWIGHLYMGIKGLSMHSPRSLVYDETVARCNRAVYFPRFLRTAARRRANVFLWLSLGHMYMWIKGMPMHSPWSPVYGETLARCTRAV